MPRSRFDKIYNLADMLGIPVSKLKSPEDFILDPNEPRLAASNGVKYCHVFFLNIRKNIHERFYPNVRCNEKILVYCFVTLLGIFFQKVDTKAQSITGL